MNRNVIITGGSKGIGKGCVEAFLKLGDIVVFCDLDEPVSAQCVSELLPFGKLYYFPCDISDYQSVKDFFFKVSKVLFSKDILINNAGIQIVSDFNSIKIEPGAFYTPMNHELSNLELETKVLSRIPLNRFAQASDIARSVVYLCSDVASCITGISLKVDGGRHLV